MKNGFSAVLNAHTKLERHEVFCRIHNHRLNTALGH
jgi:hypothetical protein